MEIFMELIEINYQKLMNFYGVVLVIIPNHIKLGMMI